MRCVAFDALSVLATCISPSLLLHAHLQIPTGLPLVFDMRHRCLKLLEGDFTQYNFGKAAELLFTPCEIADDEYEEMLELGEKVLGARVM